MAKPKQSRSSCEHKKHGPKKHMFHGYPKAIRIEMGRLGLLKKECNKEAEVQSHGAIGGSR